MERGVIFDVDCGSLPHSGVSTRPGQDACLTDRGARGELSMDEYPSSMPPSDSGGWSRSRVIFLSISGALTLALLIAVREVLLPFIDDVVQSVDIAAGQITVELMDGLMPEPRERQPRVPPRRWRSGRKN